MRVLSDFLQANLLEVSKKSNILNGKSMFLFISKAVTFLSIQQQE